MDQEVVVKLSVMDAEVIMGALVKQPYKDVAPTILKFDSQVKEQIDKMQGAKEPK